jgi:hypothetical protein
MARLNANFYGGMAPPLTKSTGTREYKQAQKNYDQYSSKYSDLILSSAGDVKKGLKEATQVRDAYKPGGSYGKGQKIQAKQNIEQGVSKSLASSVASGMSSQFGARGVNVLAASELSKLYGNIEDTRNQLMLQAFQPYAQMVSTLGNLAASGAGILNAAPKRNDYVSTSPTNAGYSMGLR